MFAGTWQDGGFWRRRGLWNADSSTGHVTYAEGLEKGGLFATTVAWKADSYTIVEARNQFLGGSCRLALVRYICGCLAKLSELYQVRVRLATVSSSPTASSVRPCNEPRLLFYAVTDILHCTTTRLLIPSNLRLYALYDAEIPDYAILSHMWGKYEVSLKMSEDPESKRLPGYTKITRCREQARSEGWKFARVDTCCMDKTSSADLSEARNIQVVCAVTIVPCLFGRRLCYYHRLDVFPEAGHCRSFLRPGQWYSTTETGMSWGRSGV